MAYAAYWEKTQCSHISSLAGHPAGRFTYASRFQSQDKQSAATPSVPASTVQPAQYEKGAASSPSTAGAAVSTAAISTVTNVGPSTGIKVSGGVTTSTGSSTATTTTGSSKVTPKAPPVSSAQAPPVSAGTTGAVGGAGKPVELVKPTVMSKVQVKSEISAKASTLAPTVDPLDALAGSLPSAKPSTTPRFTGPGILEPRVVSEEAPRCGDRDDTLPPGYRREDMEKMSAGQPEKPKEQSKPMSLDEAVSSLSSGFVSSPPGASQPKLQPETVAAVSTSTNYAPAPPTQQKQDISLPASLSPAPPADKKAKMEKPEKDSVTAASQNVKPKTEKPKKEPKADPMSLDAIEALGGTLPEAKPAPKSPELRPDQIVDEKKVTSEKGVRVGEREDTLPPDYRFKEDKDKTPAPPPPKEPTMDPTAALELLSGDFTDAAVGPAVHASVPPPAQVKQSAVEDISALDALAGDFVAPAQAKKVSSGAPPAPMPDSKNTPPKSSQAGSMSLDALDMLGDTLPEAKPVPESPKLKPEEIVHEPKHTSEKGVRVGEREDTLPPNYRFPKEDLKMQPPPAKEEPPMDHGEALDILSGGFISSSPASVVQAPVLPSAPLADAALNIPSRDFTDAAQAPVVHAPVPPPAQAKQTLADFDLQQLVGDVVAPKSASKVSSSASAAAPTGSQAGSMSLDALDMLGDTLPEAKPVPESPKLKPEEIVTEPKVKSEEGVRVGEREDTLPPDYRFPERDPKTQPPPAKKEPSLDPNDALNILSGDFTKSSPAPVVQAPVPPSAPPVDSSAGFNLQEVAGNLVAPTSASKVCSAAAFPTTRDDQLSQNSSSAMDALSDTLKDIRPAPAPEPVLPKNIVKEKKVVEERVSKAGERDDSLPPDYRPTEEDIKAAAEAKAKAEAAAAKQPVFDESKALDVLSGDFITDVPVGPSASQCQALPANTSSNQKQSGPVLDKLAATLLPDFPDSKERDTKPKKSAVADVPAAETLPAKPSTDVVSSSSTKQDRKS